jgi:hypothetical protein
VKEEHDETRLAHTMSICMGGIQWVLWRKRHKKQVLVSECPSSQLKLWNCFVACVCFVLFYLTMLPEAQITWH